jgi:hypothetical protein
MQLDASDEMPLNSNEVRNLTMHSIQSSSKISLTSEDSNRIIEAILNGKYSWACILFLRSMGHNPIDYIPYRTYYRLAKENQFHRQPPKRVSSF